MEIRLIKLCSIARFQTVILSLIIKRIRVKALVKDKRAAMESFGTYVEVSRFTLSNVISVLYFDLIHHLIFGSGYLVAIDWRSQGFFIFKEVPERC